MVLGKLESYIFFNSFYLEVCEQNKHEARVQGLHPGVTELGFCLSMTLEELFLLSLFLLPRS